MTKCKRWVLNPLLHNNNALWHLWNIMYLKILWKMEHLLQKIKCSISIIFSKVFKLILIFSWFFFNVVKKKGCHDLNLAYGVKRLKGKTERGSEEKEIRKGSKNWEWKLFLSLCSVVIFRPYTNNGLKPDAVECSHWSRPPMFAFRVFY